TKMPMVVPISTREHKRTVNQSVATPLKRTVAPDSTNQKPRNTTRKLYKHLVEIIIFIVDFGCSKHKTGNLKLLTNFVEKFLGLNHNLFSVGQFCDADLEVAFQKSTCFIRDLKGNDILTGLSPGPQSQENVPHTAETVTTSNELDLLFSLMFDELLNGTTPVVSMSSVVTAANAHDQRQQHNTTSSTSTTVVADIPPLNIQTTPETTNQAPTHAPNVTATKNINQAETDVENAQVDEDKFINIFSTPVQE
ncbi:hypothetical protein Tco_1230730, partial [Tanacetum coccineum]